MLNISTSDINKTPRKIVCLFFDPEFACYQNNEHVTGPCMKARLKILCLRTTQTDLDFCWQRSRGDDRETTWDMSLINTFFDLFILANYITNTLAFPADQLLSFPLTVLDFSKNIQGVVVF